MDIRVLQYFLAVAREESITKAAETLRMTQPPFSRQLKDLEEELGKQLLIRGSKKVTLTKEGMLLKKRAEELVELMEKTKAELTSSDENINGDIYIGCGETESIPFLAQAAQELQKKYPLIHYHIYSGDEERVMERRLLGRLDAQKQSISRKRNRQCFKPLSPTLEAELCIVWKKYQILSRASNIFLNQLQQEVENL